jgi:hypothetical protein
MLVGGLFISLRRRVSNLALSTVMSSVGMRVLSFNPLEARMKCGTVDCDQKAIDGFERFIPNRTFENPKGVIATGTISWCGLHKSDSRRPMGPLDKRLTAKQLCKKD